MPFRYNVRHVLSAFALVLLCAPFSGHIPAEEKSKATPDADAADRLFTLKILPLLKEKCLGCHGKDEADMKGGFDVRSRVAILKGGESEEAAIVPGRPEESPLYLAVLWDGLEMPPKENDRLTKEQTEQIRKWIAAGAPWPDENRQAEIRKREWSIVENKDGVLVSTSGGTSDEWTYRRYRPEDIWAFRPVKQVATPAGFSNPIDAFIRHRQEQAGVKPARQADPLTLIRRVCFDLTGLPPEPPQIDEFLAEWKKDSKRAWSDLIDRLLASPHYGERWGQHWLDVVRYADTSGFSNDYERSNAWRYRDYVIRSFNDDKPYNEFVLEQIAGDELVGLKQAGGEMAERLNRIHPRAATMHDSELLSATGFLRMGPWGTAMIPPAEARQLYLDDVVHSVGQTFLSMPMRCCRCHDHKFDPLPTRDYYRIYAALAATQPAEMPAAFSPCENQNQFDEGRKHVQTLLDYAEADRKRLVNKRETAARQWYAERKLPYRTIDERKDDPVDQKPPRHVGLDHVDEGTLKVREQDVWIWTRRLERYEPLVQSVYNGPDLTQNGRKLRQPQKINENWRPANFILTGGALDAKSEAVTPGVLSGTDLPSPVANKADPYSVSDELHGRRLGLAHWIADPRNPLTTRSIVNRIWQGHFGRGIAGTPNNFGAKGSRPTQPDLLDWLAADFVTHGWTMKRLHRLILNSETWQQASEHPDRESLAISDPGNELLAVFAPRRLTAEELRDSMLAVSGELNREFGGVPVMPEINMEIALQPRMIQFSIAPAYQPSRTPAERNRRSIYAYRVRGQADPFLEVLNLPNPNESCETRDAAAVTPQAFTLMNSDVVDDRSIAFALRLQKESDSVSAQIRGAFRLVYGRTPSGDELTAIADYVGKMQSYHEQTSPDPIVYPTETTRSLVEEFSGRPFEYTERLPVFENYVPDSKPAAVSASTRALADVCRLLLNSNEFVYVY